MVHFTDQQCYSQYPNVLKITLNIGETVESHEQSAKFYNFVINSYIDILARVALSQNSIQNAKKNREADEKKKNQEKQKQLEEEAQKRKDEKDL